MEIALMNRFSEEKMPAALSNKDGPSSEVSFTSPNIIYKKTIENHYLGYTDVRHVDTISLKNLENF